jgi:formate-dependent nitrite reductase complex subunit NrfG
MSRLACLLALAVAFVACAAPHPSEEAHRIEGQVWSPYCPGRLLIDCPTKQADELRTEISRRLGAGQSSDDVMRWIRLNFGNEAIARPSGQDTVLIWSFPVALFAIGTTLLVFLLRRWTRQRVA